MDLSRLIKEKTQEFTGTFQTFFLYKIADRIGTNIVNDDHNNHLAILALLIGSVVVTSSVAHFTQVIVETASAHTPGEATLIGWVRAPVYLFIDLLGAVAAWETQLFSVVCGNYVTLYSNEEAFEAIPITLAVGAFLFLAKQTIFPPNEYRFQ